MRELSVRLKWLSIRENLRDRDFREKLKSPSIKLNKKPDMLHSRLKLRREKLLPRPIGSFVKQNGELQHQQPRLPPL